MRKLMFFWLGIVAAIFLAGQSFAQLTTTGVGKKPGGGSSYTGPCDVVAGCTFYYSLRAASSAKRGTKSINVCNVSDVACGDLSTDATTGDLVVSAIGGSSCSIITCTVKTIYDQGTGTFCTGSAPCDLTQATIGTRPTLVVNCVGGKPCLACSGSQHLDSTSFPTGNQPFTISGVAKRTGGTTAFGDILGLHSTVQLLFGNSVNTLGVYAGVVQTVTAADNSWHAIQALVQDNISMQSKLYVDGTSTNISPSNSNFNTDVQLCSDNNPLTGNVAETGVWVGTAFNGTQDAAMNTNQHTYWGF